MIQFNIQFNSISRKFNSKNYSIFFLLKYSIQKVIHFQISEEIQFKKIIQNWIFSWIQFKKLFKAGFFLGFNSKKLFKTGFFLGFNSKKYSLNTKKGVPPRATETHRLNLMYGPRILSPKLESYLKAETNANSNFAL